MSGIEKLGLTEKQLKDLRSIWLPPPLEVEERNALVNRRMLDARFDDFDVRLLSGLKRKNDSVIVMSSGSSLNAVLKDLRDWSGDIICSTSPDPKQFYLRVIRILRIPCNAIVVEDFSLISYRIDVISSTPPDGIEVI